MGERGTSSQVSVVRRSHGGWRLKKKGNAPSRRRRGSQKS
jgi:hypothetical protein